MYCEFALDTDVLRAGVASGLEALESAAREVAQLREGACTRATLDEAGACLHRAGRTATTVGLSEIARSTQEVEAVLYRILATRREPSEEEVSLLEEALALLTALLLNVNVRTGAYTVADGTGCLERLRSACA
jgi:DNA-binding phage protein